MAKDLETSRILDDQQLEISKERRSLVKMW